MADSIDTDRTRALKRTSKKVALYHRVFATEDFTKSAQTLLRLVHNAEQRWPGVERWLYLDIDGHRNRAGGFDNEMLELQQEFVVGFLLPFMKQAVLPLWTVVNKRKQHASVPEALAFRTYTDADGPQRYKMVDGVPHVWHERDQQWLAFYGEVPESWTRVDN